MTLILCMLLSADWPTDEVITCICFLDETFKLREEFFHWIVCVLALAQGIILLCAVEVLFPPIKMERLISVICVYDKKNCADDVLVSVRWI